MRATSLRVLAALAARDGLCMRRWNFIAADLEGELEQEEVVYCRAPPGYETLGSDGRAQVFKVWGYTQCSTEPCVFTAKRKVNGNTQRLIIGCYVDDLFALNSDNGPGSLYESFISDLAARWNVEDGGPHKYIAHLVETYLPDGVPSSFQKHHAPAAEELPALVEKALASQSAGSQPPPDLRSSYQSLVGALLYCSTQACPDVAYDVGMLCRAMSRPTPELLNAARRVLCYLSHHRHVGRRYAAVANPHPVTGFSDSDWATRHTVQLLVPLWHT
eukprot:2684561-Pleurochrysis_carterae.AAC.1